MRLKNTPLVNVVRREQKEQKIAEFLQDHLTKPVVETPLNANASKRVLLLARSAQSPVARMIASLSETLRNSGIELQVIFTRIDNDAASLAWTSASSEITCRREVRLTKNEALLDAHEQLVLDETTSWTGDSMRRDPNRGDAYECYAADCAEAAQFTAKSFERLWLTSAPLVTLGGEPADGAEPCCDETSAAPESTELGFIDDTTDTAGPLAATRH